MLTDFYSRAFEVTLFPILDWLNGTQIAEKLALLKHSEHASPTDIRSRQEAKLAIAVERARRSSEFYRTFWQSGSNERGIPSAYAPLDGLPVLTKADLQKARTAFPLPGCKGRIIRTRTSGSTGSPMTFYRSAEQESWFWALRFRIWSWAGYRPGDPYLEINLNPRVDLKKRLQDLLFRCSYQTFTTDNQDSRRIVHALGSRRIPHLNGFASSLFVLAQHMLAEAIPNPGVRGITSTGDSLYDAYRETIEAAFGTRVLDYYGAGGEGVHLASQCMESGPRYHLHPENAVVELLGPSGPVPPGELGRIVVTQLDNDAMPLIRYDLDDVAAAASEGARCPCGRTLPLLERIEGRVPDLVVAPDGAFLVPHFFVVLFKNLQAIDRYQIVQERLDRIRVRLVPRRGAVTHKIEATVRRAVDAATHGSMQADCEWTDAIPLSGSGKRRLVISEISRAALAGTAEGCRAPLHA